MRIKHCFVPNCLSTNERNPGLSFHSLPSNERILQQWVKNMDREDRILNSPKSTQKHYFVCGKHFLDSCFQTYERKKLNRGAIPTIFTTITTSTTTTIVTTKAKKPIPNIIKRDATQPLILNHQIVFPSAFESLETSQSMVPSEVEVEVEVEAVDSVVPVESIQTEVSSVQATKPPPSVGNEVTNAAGDGSVEQLLSNIFDDSKDRSRKPPIKYRNKKEQHTIKPAKKFIRRMLLRAKKTMSQLKKCKGQCMELFNDRFGTIFNNKIIKNLQKVDSMPALVRTYMNHQIKYLPTQKSNSAKYKRHEIPFYAALYKSNKSAYQFLSKVFNIPSRQRIEQFFKNTIFNSGVNAVLLEHLKRNVRMRNPLNRYCTLLFKEIRICPHLSYNSETDTTEGIEVNGTERTTNIVNQCFIFYLCGLRKSWKQPIAYYFVSNRTRSLHSCIVEVVEAIHRRTDLFIVASMSPLTTVNTDAIYSLMEPTSNVFVYQVEGREFVHVFDPACLLKLLRNQFMNCDIIYGENRVAKWSKFVELLKSGKLTNAHINPNKEQMKQTKLAAQLFSLSVSEQIEDPDTAHFCLFINQLYDSFNGRLDNNTASTKSYFKFWEEAETILQSFRFVDKQSFFVAQAFILNIKNMRKLIEINGFRCVNTKYLKLDPLENFHAVLRHFSGNYPTSLQFQEAFKISLFNEKFRNPDAWCQPDEAEGFLCPVQPEVFCSEQCLSPVSNTRLFSAVLYKLVQKVHLYSDESVVKFLAANVLNLKCDTCVKVFSNECKGRSIKANDALIREINLLQREIYQIITTYLNHEQFIEMLYTFAEEVWRFDFACAQHKYEMKYKTIVSICFIMVKCFIEITNKMLWKQLTKK